MNKIRYIPWFSSWKGETYTKSSATEIITNFINLVTQISRCVIIFYFKH